jgi:hypothetical protein
MRLIRFAVLGSLAALLAGAGLALVLGGSGAASAAGEAMAVDCDASTVAVDTTCSYGPSATFQISVQATNAGDGSGYTGYQVKPRWTAATLHYNAASDANAENKWPVACYAGRVDHQPGDPSVFYGCGSVPPVTSTYTGPLAQFEMQCQTPGTTAINLVASAGDAEGGTVFVDSLFTAVDPALTSASVTCRAEGEATPTPSNTPAATSTPTVGPTVVSTGSPSPTPVTPTPTLGPGQTPTPTPTATTLSTPGVGLKGDANGDGHTNSIDAAIVLQYVAGLVGSLPSRSNADVNHSGSVDSIDAALILQIDAGLLPQPS